MKLLGVAYVDAILSVPSHRFTLTGREPLGTEIQPMINRVEKCSTMPGTGARRFLRTGREGGAADSGSGARTSPLARVLAARATRVIVDPSLIDPLPSAAARPTPDVHVHRRWTR
jgi:hypothetical protein